MNGIKGDPASAPLSAVSNDNGHSGRAAGTSCAAERWMPARCDLNEPSRIPQDRAFCGLGHDVFFVAHIVLISNDDDMTEALHIVICNVH
ncbi:hypothetical protein EYF80_034279 [Liparis tanakae]|uniref:Uncharacterized protein n=1 Tax=Liparis tanakae TaxID=230148 RepID=A0A4Z2GPP6_9TELE|nr:hypothetical protein EYF80_034279 [Liparis tanakae]